MREHLPDRRKFLHSKGGDVKVAATSGKLKNSPLQVER